MKKKSEIQSSKEVKVTDISFNINSLDKFSQSFPSTSNVISPLIYFGDGMSPVDSPFVFKSDHVNAIVDKNKVLSNVDEGYTRSMINKSIKDIYNNRVSFLTRSLLLNLDERIYNVIKIYDIDCHYSYYEGNYTSLKKLKDTVLLENFLSVDEDIDNTTTHLYNEYIVTSIVTQIYDHYDKLIVDSIRYGKNDRNNKGKTMETIHYEILSDLAPIFTLFKSQLQWLVYTLRYECRFVYRPMMVI